MLNFLSHYHACAGADDIGFEAFSNPKVPVRSAPRNRTPDFPKDLTAPGMVWRLFTKRLQ
jgi:hypothetical protein